MDTNYRDLISCACIGCTAPLFRMRKMPDGNTVPLCNAHTARYALKGVLGGPTRAKAGIRTICNYPGCTALHVKGQDRCSEHLKLVRPDATCSYPGCTTHVADAGYRHCKEHTLPSQCEAPGCDRKPEARHARTRVAYCITHYQRSSRNNGDPYADIPFNIHGLGSLAAIRARGLSGSGGMGQTSVATPSPSLPSVQTDSGPNG